MLRTGNLPAGLLTVALAACSSCSAPAEPLPFTGVNLAGGEFYEPKPGVRPVHGTNFIYPCEEDIAYFAGHGMNIFRYPFRWETLQPAAKQPLDSEEVQRLKAAVELATSRGCVVILDPHNYARYYGKPIGGGEVSVDDFADFWRRLAGEFASNPLVWFGLMNEPYDMPTKLWFEAAQAAIHAIRGTGAHNFILVPGNAWSGAHSWTATWYGESNAQYAAVIDDPLDHWAIEVHQYLDADCSGTGTEVVSATVGSERLADFVKWCRQHKLRAFLGEFGAPNTPLAREAVEDMLRAMERDRDVWLGWTWWAAGRWWGNYPMSIQPDEAGDKPQMAWLRPHVQGRTAKDLPLGAALLGYTKCIINERPTAEDIAPGSRGDYKWFSGQWWYSDRAPSLDHYSTVDGVLAISLGGDLVSAPHDFSPGKLPLLPGPDGFYVEFESWLSDNEPDHWPALWLMPAEHNARGDDHYPGDPPDFRRFMEFDIDEGGFGPGLTGTVHSCWGIWSPEKGYEQIQNPNNVSPIPLDRTQKHVFAGSYDPVRQKVTWWVDGVKQMWAGPPYVPEVAAKQHFYIILSAQSHGQQKPYRMFVGAVKAYVPPHSKLPEVASTAPGLAEGHSQRP
ncbi:MAG: cellulase family glycosylhydrolase [Armatimonadetes bacterium]|nr:cellulase family glycosylhydrolase [Armatimonadota bacterium]